MGHSVNDGGSCLALEVALRGTRTNCSGQGHLNPYDLVENKGHNHKTWGKWGSKLGVKDESLVHPVIHSTNIRSSNPLSE